MRRRSIQERTAKKKALIVMTDEGKKEHDVNDDT
jgi:hypothetical protein